MVPDTLFWHWNLDYKQNIKWSALWLTRHSMRFRGRYRNTFPSHGHKSKYGSSRRQNENGPSAFETINETTAAFDCRRSRSQWERRGEGDLAISGIPFHFRWEGERRHNAAQVALQGTGLLKYYGQRGTKSLVACTWLGELSSCSCLTALPDPACVLLSKIYKTLSSPL